MSDDLRDRRRRIRRLAASCVAWLAAIGAAGCGGRPAEAPAGADPEPLTQQRALAADREPGNWLLHGRTFDEQFFSPLTTINDATVAGLGVAWTTDLASPTGIVSQPLMVDGTIFLTGTFSRLFALDAATGRIRWDFMPSNLKRSAGSGANPLSIWNLGANRGAAYWARRVYLTTGDCRLIAVDASSGKAAWEATVCDTTRGYGISGAPRAADGMIFVGSTGSDNGVRGFVAAYDAETGRERWRFHTVPADVDGKFENELMARAAATWSGTNYRNGGGVVWDKMTYDPEFKRLYIGTSCGAPSDASVRNPRGGDEWFLCAIVALDAATGRYVWHFSVNPNFRWDFDAAMSMVLADLVIDGAPRKVLMQAPKNGFLLVIDRANGRLISARNYVRVNWASGYDAQGRPVTLPDADYSRRPKDTTLVWPNDGGAHNWQPMSFSRQTGLVYIPTCEFPSAFSKGVPGAFGGATVQVVPFDQLHGQVPEMLGRLVAWDPMTQSQRWAFPYRTACNGGVLSTAGNLVFQGDARGMARAFAAQSGQVLWSHDLGSAVQSAPITYEVGGEQYVLFVVGLGGASRFGFAALSSPGPSRAIALKLGGRASIPRWREPPLPQPAAPDDAPAERVALGEQLYGAGWCVICHGFSARGTAASLYPDLRRMTRATYDDWLNIVRGGSRSERGMLSFADQLDEQQALAIRDYINHVAWQDYRQQEGSTAADP